MKDKAKMDLNIQDKRHINLFREVHPKTSKDMSDDEIEKLGDMIDEIHNDKTPRRFKDVTTMSDGQKMVIVSDGKEEYAIPLMKVPNKELNNG